MKSLEFNTKSWHSRLYQSTYGSGLPSTICGYFWKLLLAILVAIPCWPAHAFNIITKEYSTGIVAVIHVPLLIVAGAFLHMEEKVGTTPLYTLYWQGIIVIIGFSIALTIGILICLFIGNLYEYLTQSAFKKKKKKEKKPSPITEGWKAFIGKYCTPINWT